MKTCPKCGKEFKNLGVHMKAHKGDDDAMQQRQETQKIPKWRLRTPTFTDGQAGIRIPPARLRRGVKQVGS